MLDIPSFNVLKKSVSSKFIATVTNYTLDPLPSVPHNETALIIPEVKNCITTDFNSLVCSIQNEIKLGHTVFYNFIGNRRPVLDIGICNTITPLMVLRLKGGATEHIKLEDYTPHSLGKMFTQEIIKHFG